jgi:hypothetical protein
MCSVDAEELKQKKSGRKENAKAGSESSSCTNLGEIFRINAGRFCWDFQQNTCYGSITRARGTLAACPVCKIGSHVIMSRDTSVFNSQCICPKDHKIPKDWDEMVSSNGGHLSQRAGSQMPKRHGSCGRTVPGAGANTPPSPHHPTFPWQTIQFLYFIFKIHLHIVHKLHIIQTIYISTSSSSLHLPLRHVEQPVPFLLFRLSEFFQLGPDD